MVKRISVAIADDIYENLSAFSNYYNENIQNAIKSILKIISMESPWITNLKNDYKVPVNLINVLAHVFRAAFHSLSFFNKVLEKMDVKGLYMLEDFEFDLDKNYMWLYYSALANCNLKIDAFDLTIQPGLKSLTTYSYIEAGKANKRILRDLKRLIQSVQVPEEFDYLENYDIEIIEEEEFWTLKIDCKADSFDNLQSIKRISSFVEQVFKKAGIKI
ncbi:MAG: hypothetical protein QW090_04835 [Candidatus Bathyarchaeia archaeon]